MKTAGIDKKPLREQIAMIEGGHAVNNEYIPQLINNVLQLDIKQYFYLNGDVSRGYKDICSWLGSINDNESEVDYTIADVVQEIQRQLKDENELDRELRYESFDDKADIYSAVFDIACPIAWRRKLQRKQYKI